MSAATRVTDLCTGHQCYPPREALTGSPNVFINGKAVHRKGDFWAVHSCGEDIGAHSGKLVSGSKTVLVNNTEPGRIGDPISCGSKVMKGSPNVYIGD